MKFMITNTVQQETNIIIQQINIAVQSILGIIFFNKIMSKLQSQIVWQDYIWNAEIQIFMLKTSLLS